ncbi:hypothetical protein PMAYCL1PPCAC_18537 [Pristionchus mayeri]|uniref:EGF-like domain-containing protein n=1 Tax=Pristionchus mayeri TaxID=1317129 RepID=A0AAN5I1E2_9BILA|nr:hypothetical protein PMAYCL1PPCAC_18537 [Pristionchus mayeri]
MIPSASLLMVLPGFSSLRPPFPSPSLPLLILLFLPVADGCSPSWFREERSVPSMANSKEFQVQELAFTSSEEEEDTESSAILLPERPCGPEHRGHCANGSGCKLHYAPLAERWDPTCTCSKGYIGSRCDQPYDPHVFAAPLEVGGRSHTSLAAMSFFAALSLITLGAALFFYKKLMREEEWELTETCTMNTPFSNRTNSTLHRRNVFCNTSMYSSNTTSLNPALCKKGALNLDDSPIEIALDATITSMVVEHHRDTITSKNNSQRFLITPHDASADCFDRQYYHFYNARFEALKGRVLANAKKIVDPNVVVRLLEDLADEEMAFVIGTIEKRVDSRPSVLKEIAEEEAKIAEADENETAACNLFAKKDYMEIEDETQIVKLSGNIDMNEVTVGSIVGLWGKMVPGNLFEVDKWVWPTAASQNDLPQERPPYTMAFISGLNLRGSDEVLAKTRAALQLFIRWITGCGTDEKESERALRVVRLFICGSSISAPDVETEMKEMATSITREDPFIDQDALTTVDDLISILVKTIEVDVLPGLGDPSLCMLPQQPFPRCAFTKGGESRHLRMHTNPSDIIIGGIEFIISSGQNVSDLSSSPVEAMSLILKSQHFAPTCPDTVDGFPFEDRDPFVIDRFPHVIVAGNQARAESKQVEFEEGRSCLLVGVPTFSESHTITLLDLETLEVSNKHFGFE